MTTPGNQAEIPDGRPRALPFYLVDASGNVVSSTNGLQVVIASGEATSTAINDGTSITQKMAVDATGNASVNIGKVGAAAFALGQANMAGSLPVTIASNQGAIGSVVAQAVAGTALAADQTNSILRSSLYVKKTVAGDTVLILGSATSANSLPVVIASDQAGPLPIAGMVASGGANANNPAKIGAVFNTTQPTVTNAQVVDLQATARGAAIVSTGVDTFNVTVNAALPAGSAVIGSTTIQATSGTALLADQTNSELRVSNYVKTTTAGDTALTLGQATMANSLPVTIASNQGAIGSVVVQAVAGTALVADQTNSELRVSTYVKTTTAGDTALTLGSTTGANSVPVVIASNQGAVAVGVTSGTAFDGNAGTIGANTLRTVAGGAATGTKSNVASSASSVTILASNTSRKGAIIYNDSTQILYLDLTGGTASTSSYSVQVPSNGYFELPPPNIYNGALTGIWAAANGNARVTEFS